MLGGYAHKNGEVADPAGGVTGSPRCLAEVYKPLDAADYHNSNLHDFGKFVNVFF